MKTRIFALWLVMAPGALSAASKELRCQTVFQNEITLLLAPNSSQQAARTVEKFFKHEGREIYYRVDSPQGKAQGTVLVIHGLGDHSGRLNALADQLLVAGQKVIRIDLHGHGRTLRRELELGEPADHKVVFETQVDDVVALMESLKIDEYSIIGHSYGGGVATAVASRLTKNYEGRETPLKKMILLAPFVVDLRTYYQSGLLSRDTMWDAYLKTISAIPGAQDLASAGKNIFDVMVARGLLRLREAYRATHPLSSATIDALKAKSAEATTKMMESSYGKYFMYFAKQEGFGGHPKVQETIHYATQSAIQATEGISEYSLFSPVFKPWSPEIQTTLIAGRKDGLVPLDLLQKTKLHLENLGVPLQFETVDSGHMIPQTLPEQVRNILTDPAVAP